MSQLYDPPWAKLYYFEVVVDVARMFSFLLPIKPKQLSLQGSCCWPFSEFCNSWKISVFFINTTDICLA